MESENKMKKKDINSIFNKKYLLIIAAIILLFLSIVFLFSTKGGNSNGISNLDNSYSAKPNPTKYQKLTDSQASVTIDVLPKELGIDKERNIFEISLDTHSVNLDFDFRKIMVLKDDLGNGYEALQWTGGSGSHHISGEIIFPEINKSAKKVRLEINGIGEVERSFEWNLTI